MPVTLATSLPKGTDIGVENAGIIQSVGATRTLQANESGATCLFDSAAGVVYTLPPCALNLTFNFLVTVTITSNAAKFITSAASEFLVGGCGSFSSAVAEGGDAFVANGTTHRAMSSNGTTTGGAVGQLFTVTGISSTQWAVTGNTIGSGTMADPFATS